jgi:hypothetical protein
MSSFLEDGAWFPTVEPFVIPLCEPGWQGILNAYDIAMQDLLAYSADLNPVSVDVTAEDALLRHSRLCSISDMLSKLLMQNDSFLSGAELWASGCEAVFTHESTVLSDELNKAGLRSTSDPVAMVGYELLASDTVQGRFDRVDVGPCYDIASEQSDIIPYVLTISLYNALVTPVSGQPSFLPGFSSLLLSDSARLGRVAVYE